MILHPPFALKNNLTFPGQYFDIETGLHYNWHRYYDPQTGRYITADPIGLAGGLNLFLYAGGNPVNAVDPMGLTWGDTFKMFSEWALGRGSDSRVFGPGSNQVNDLKDSPGVKVAINYFYAKNADASCGCGQGGYESLTNYAAGFGASGYLKAGLDSTEQFVGSFRVDIYPDNSNCTITIMLSNTTSMTSFLGGKVGSWERSSFPLGGNTRQVYWWTEAIKK